MKKHFQRILSALTGAALAVSMFPAAAAERTADEYDSLFKQDTVIDVNITVREEDLQDMRDFAAYEEYHSADITIDGNTVENAGIRTKGNISLSSIVGSDSDRYSYRIKSDKYVKGQELLGLDELCLNNMYADASYMREYLHYEILRELGMNVPQTVFCNLSINGEPVGLYLGVEALDDSFLKNNFGQSYKDGNFYKMDMGATLQYQENSEYTYADLKMGSDTEKTGLKSFIKTLNELPDGEKGEIESILDVDSALKYIASNTVLSNYDSYNGNMHHNYYLYEDSSGKFTVVPWDFNMSFGGFSGNTATIGIDTPIASGSLDTLPLIGKLLAVDAYKNRYYDYIRQIMDLLETFEDRVNELSGLIKPYIEQDATAFFTLEEFEKATTYDPSYTEASFSGEPKPGSDWGQPSGSDEPIASGSVLEENKKHNPGAMGGNATKSIVNCVVNRLENLKAQFAGTASKETQVQQGAPGGIGRPDNMGIQDGTGPSESDMTPSNDMMPPEGQNGGAFPGGMTPPDQTQFPGQNHRPGGMGGHSTEPSSIRVLVNGNIVTFDTEPVIENDRTLVPFRAIAQALGAQVDWDESTNQVTVSNEDNTIILIPGSDTVYVNGGAVTLDTPAKIDENDRLLLPVRFVAETFGLKVTWTQESKLVTLIKKQ